MVDSRGGVGTALFSPCHGTVWRGSSPGVDLLLECLESGIKRGSQLVESGIKRGEVRIESGIKLVPSLSKCASILRIMSSNIGVMAFDVAWVLAIAVFRARSRTAPRAGCGMAAPSSTAGGPPSRRRWIEAASDCRRQRRSRWFAWQPSSLAEETVAARSCCAEEVVVGMMAGEGKGGQAFFLRPVATFPPQQQ